MRLTPYRINKALKPKYVFLLKFTGLTPYRINKALKHPWELIQSQKCLTPYRINKALKPQIHLELITEPIHFAKCR